MIERGLDEVDIIRLNQALREENSQLKAELAEDKKPKPQPEFPETVKILAAEVKKLQVELAEARKPKEPRARDVLKGVDLVAHGFASKN